MPRRSSRGEEDSERNALLLFAYFHLFTLRTGLASEHVPHPANMREDGGSWANALEFWLAGNVLCKEAQTYIRNFLNVTQCRPMDPDEAGHNSEDVYSEEELGLSTDRLAVALQTSSGGSKDPKDDKKGHEETMASHENPFEECESTWHLVSGNELRQRIPEQCPYAAEADTI